MASYYFVLEDFYMKVLAYTFRPPFSPFLPQILKTGRKNPFEKNKLEDMPAAAPGSG